MIFLADGDALVLEVSELKAILLRIKELFPECERVGIYATPRDILRKSLEELKELKKFCIGIVYLGVESESSEILRNIKDVEKGIFKMLTPEEIMPQILCRFWGHCQGIKIS